jgi:hypothetical protein
MDTDRDLSPAVTPGGDRTGLPARKLKGPVWCRAKPMPIFVLSYNRGEMLRTVVEGYRRLSPGSDIVIHDFGSDCPVTRDVLDAMEARGHVVNRADRIDSADDLERVNETIDLYFADWSEPGRYVVTDCDIDISGAGLSSLDVYVELLERYSDAECVGPMLSIRDIPATYPLYWRAVNSHVEQFWRKEPQWAVLANGDRAAFQRAPIDTTFAVHRAGERFRRKKTGLRVYHPYEARHLDWYKTREDILSSTFGRTASSGISHWAVSSVVGDQQDSYPAFERFIAVRSTDDGGLQRIEYELPGRAADAVVAEPGGYAPVIGMAAPYPAAGARSRPVIVSAYAGDRYYHDCAVRLKADCDRLGLKHHIVEWDLSEGDDWIAICRRKVGFMKEALALYPDGVFWVDVDSQLYKVPRFLDSLSGDIAAYLRGLKYLRDFDPAAVSRFFVPGFLYLSGSPACLEFVDLMVRLEREYVGQATDDYFLHEAWLQHERQLTVTILPPSTLHFADQPRTEDHAIFVGLSGRAKPNAAVAAQHGAPKIDDTALVKALRTLSRRALDRKDGIQRVAFMRELITLAPADQSNAASLIRYSKSPENLALARGLLSAAEASWQPPLIALRTWLEVELELENFDVAWDICERLSGSEDQSDRDYAKSKRYLLELERRARELGVPASKRPRLWWMEAPYPGNLGDIISPYIVEKLTGFPPSLRSARNSAIVVGSIIKFAEDKTKVWGSGTPRMTDKLNPNADYRAVRGPLTRQLVLESGGKCEPVYGDVACFMPKIYWPEVEKKHDLGLIRHMVHLNRPIRLEGVQEISVIRIGDEEIEAFIRELLACRKIVSTSLHGIILAHAYGIPAEWATFQDGQQGLKGDETKFWDYFESVGIERHFPMDLAGIDVIDASYAEKVTRLPKTEIDLKALARVSPFALQPEWY